MTRVPTPTPTRKAKADSRGTVRLIAAPVPGGRLGELLINHKHYLVQHTPTGFRLCCKVDRQGDPVAYDLPATLESCDCPDATYRPRAGGCKHVKALRALRAAGKPPQQQ